MGVFDGLAPLNVLVRALFGLFGGLMLGMVVGWLGMFIVQDNVPKTDAKKNSPARAG